MPTPHIAIAARSPIGLNPHAVDQNVCLEEADGGRWFV
jgi:hypothetical protein